MRSILENNCGMKVQYFWDSQWWTIGTFNYKRLKRLCSREGKLKVSIICIIIWWPYLSGNIFILCHGLTVFWHVYVGYTNITGKFEWSVVLKGVGTRNVLIQTSKYSLPSFSETGNQICQKVRIVLTGSTREVVFAWRHWRLDQSEQLKTMVLVPSRVIVKHVTI